MSDTSNRAERTAAARTPTGTQSARELARRRSVLLVLCLVTWVAMLAGAATVLGDGGWTLVDIAMMTCIVLGTPWTVLGFWNALIGLWLLHGVRDGLARTSAFAEAGEADTPLTLSTAILMTLRNEDPARALHRLRIVKDSLETTGHGAAFTYYILSDTSRPEIADAEESIIAELRARFDDADRLVYRRRTDNAGYKAGNIRDFCLRWGGRHDLMLPLDADSLMSGETILRLVRIMQAHPRLGILQSLVVGMPSQSAFARIFQFGMRQGMRSYITGFAWWVGDCGPYWGHNALIRIAPFRDHCQLPEIAGGPPFGGPVMSHDQVEATLMRRAGYEVRVLPRECGSWEENPPTFAEFSRRDLRWCQGNMQYTRLLDTPGLLPTSRFQLIWAILMFIGVPAWSAMIALLPLKALETADLATFPARLAITLYLLFIVMYLSPKLIGFLDLLLTPGAAARYGGVGRLAVGVAVETIFTFLLGASGAPRVTVFMLGLLAGRAITWREQSRDAHGVSLREAWNAHWPLLVFGLYVLGGLAMLAPCAALWSLPMTAGYLLAIPFTMLTASPQVGRWMARHRLLAIPEEFSIPPEIAALDR